jgi:Tol biopolymer transport system component
MRDDGLAQYSPDGTKIVFTTNRTGIFEVWVCESDGSNAVQITTLGKGVAGNPRWAQDGRRIIFDSNADGNWDIYTVSATGGGLRRLTNRRANVMGSFSRDGNHIYFRSDRSGTWQIWRMPADGGEATQLTRNGGLSPVESIDGKFVYYVTGGRLWKVSVQGGEESEVLQSIWASNYVIGHEGIYFMTMPDLAHNKNSIQFFSFESGKAAAVAAIPGIPGWGFSVSPDEKFLTYTQMDQRGSDLMLVENFR